MPKPQQFGNLEANLGFLNQTGVITAGTRVLEIGAGTGAMLDALTRRGAAARGVELRQDLIAEAHRHFPALLIDRVSSTTLPYPNASFDVVVSFDVFEHIPDSDAHLSEVRRVLVRGGWYLLQTPNKYTNVIFETIRWRSFTRFREDHCSLHSLGELIARLRRHGFTPQPYDVPVVNQFFREKVRAYAGVPGSIALALVNPDRLPRAWRTNLYVAARDTRQP